MTLTSRRLRCGRLPGHPDSDITPFDYRSGHGEQDADLPRASAARTHPSGRSCWVCCLRSSLPQRAGHSSTSSRFCLGRCRQSCVLSESNSLSSESAATPAHLAPVRRLARGRRAGASLLRVRRLLLPQWMVVRQRRVVSSCGRNVLLRAVQRRSRVQGNTGRDAEVAPVH
jgi:hypothetical protein